MARSVLERIWGRVIQLIILGLVFGFVPYMVFQSACGVTNQAKVNEQYNPTPKRFGAPPPASKEKDAPAAAP